MAMGTALSARARFAAGAVIGLLAIAGCGGDDDSDEPQPLSTQDVIAKGTPGTVSLTGEVSGIPIGGSGVVIESEGENLILTNAHVVESVDRLKAKVGDQAPVAARVRALAPCDDIAVVEFVQDPAEVTPLTLGDSAALAAGAPVVALGFPDNFQQPDQQTIQSTDGTVSNTDVVGEEIDASLPTYQSLVQHQAALNPGNSGGPLLNDLGEVVGINTLSRGAEGIENQGYAISSEYIETILPDLVAGNDRLRLGWDLRPYKQIDLRTEFKYFLGDKVDPGLAADIVGEAGFNGMYVFGTEPDLPADKASIFPGDLLTDMDGVNIQSMTDVCDTLASAEPGETVEVSGTIIASGGVGDIGDTFTVDMKVPEEPAATTETTTTTGETTAAE
jgi:S1-C subfamily serine protease